MIGPSPRYLDVSFWRAVAILGGTLIYNFRSFLFVATVIGTVGILGLASVQLMRFDEHSPRPAKYLDLMDHIPTDFEGPILAEYWIAHPLAQVGGLTTFPVNRGAHYRPWLTDVARYRKSLDLLADKTPEQALLISLGAGGHRLDLDAIAARFGPPLAVERYNLSGQEAIFMYVRSTPVIAALRHDIDATLDRCK